MTRGGRHRGGLGAAGRRSTRTRSGTASSPGTTTGVRAAQRIFPAPASARRHAVANPLDEDLSQLGHRRPHGALRPGGAAAGQAGRRRRAGRRRPRARGRRPVRRRHLHRVRHPGPGHPAGQRPRHAARACSGCSSGTWAATPRSRAWPRSATSSTARSRPAVLLCCELTSLHVQPAQRRPRAGRRARAVLRRRRGRRPRAGRRRAAAGWPASSPAPTPPPPTT